MDSRFQSHRVGEGGFNSEFKRIFRKVSKFQSHRVGEGGFT